MAKTGTQQEENSQNSTPRQIERRKIKLHTAVNHYFRVSQSFEEIARAVNVPQTIIEDWFKSEDWQKAVNFWRLTGQKPAASPKGKTPPLKVPHTLTERYLLEKAFQENDDLIRFVTYNGFVDANVETIETYDIKLKGRKNPLPKHNVLLAFPKSSMIVLKARIVRRERIANKKLGPITKKDKKPHITDRVKNGDSIECIMRNGLVIKGTNVWTSKYNIVLRVGGTEDKSRGTGILIYRHGLLKCSVIEPKPNPYVDPNDDKWNDE